MKARLLGLDRQAVAAIACQLFVLGDVCDIDDGRRDGECEVVDELHNACILQHIYML